MDAVSPPESRRHARKSAKSRQHLRVVRIPAGALALAGVLEIDGYVWSVGQSFNAVEKIDISFPDEATRPTVAPVEGKSSPVNILLLRSDSRAGTTDIHGSRSDAMMLVHVPSDWENIQVMSFMRDLWVEIPGYGEARFNAATGYGCIPLLVQTLEGVAGVRIDHVAVVAFEAFKGIANVLGGVTVNTPEEFSSSGKYFPAEQATLSGEQALRLESERYAFSDGDYSRVRNQQVLVSALLGRVLSAETLTNPATIQGLVGAVAPYIAVDKGLNAAKLAELGFELRGVRVDNGTFMTVPTSGTGRVGEPVCRVPRHECLCASRDSAVSG